jgi:hypothetical protein
VPPNDEVTAGRNYDRKRPKGYASWRPRQETQVVLAQVEEVLREYRAHLPLTARQVFYRLVAAFGYPKDELAYERLCNALGRARRARHIPFDYLRDDGTNVMQEEHHTNVEGFYARVRELGGRYERDKLARQPLAMRVYCEAAGMMPQLARVCRRYSVPVYSGSGFDSLTAKYDLARSCMAAYTYRGKSTAILHLGDYDPSGVSIYDSMREDVLAFLSRDVPHVAPSRVAIFKRVVLTAEQVRLHGLPTAPPKRSDGRSMRWTGDTCQLEALPPDALEGLLADAIEAFLDSRILAEDREAEERERRQIARALPGAKA